VFINKIKLKNFRNFKDKQFAFDSRIVLVEGVNGSGKTSLLEALYYACYLKSFRTHLSKELIAINNDYFFTQLDFEDDLSQANQIQVGLSTKDGKLVKLNKKAVASYKDIVSRIKIISIAEDDLAIVQGAPDIRRAFLNQFLILLNPEILNLLKEYKQILQHRNSLLLKNQQVLNKQKDEFYIWSRQLWEKSIKIQKQRIEFLKQLEKEVNDLLEQYFPSENLSISLCYKSKKIDNNKTFDQFWQLYQEKIMEEEIRWGRSLFGVHLDDFLINFQDKKARVFASRGQQKLILFLIKVAQLRQLYKSKELGCMLLDDFLTDFDLKRAQNCLNILKNFENQIFLTYPLKSDIFSRFLKDEKAQIIKL